MMNQYITKKYTDGNINNLEFIPWRGNIDKRISCSISKTELLNIN